MGLATSSTGKISEKELELVKESWKIIMENPEENGTIILKTFLDKHDYYSSFKKFQGIPVNTLPENKTFRSHALAIIQTIDQITQNINNLENMKILLNKLGKQHKLKNIKPNQFTELKIVILEILKTAFALPEEGLNAWSKTFDIAFAYIFESLQEGES